MSDSDIHHSDASNPPAAAWRDLGCAALLIAVGLVVLIATLDLERTNDMGMGPGYFPRLCGTLLLAIGAVIGLLSGRRLVIARRTPLHAQDGRDALELRALRSDVARALTVTASVAAFALLLPVAGLVLSTFALVLIATRGSDAMSIRTALAIAAVLSLIGVTLFIFGLGLPMSVFPPALT